MRIIFPLLIVVFCIAFNNVAYGHGVQLLQQPNTGQVAIPTAIIAGLRGGKKSLHKSNSKTHSKISTGKAKMVQNAKYPSTDDDDDDDNTADDEDDIPRHNRKSSRSLHKPKSKTTKKNVKHRSLVPWASKVFPSKRKFAFVQDGLEKLAKTGSSAYKDIFRRAKVLKSSTFEGLLLKATWPGNEAVPSSILTEIIKYSIPAFRYSRSDSDDDPYYMTLHKLWTKMAETDWRTVAKSLFILHSISRDCSVEACRKFGSAIRDLSKTRNPKRPDQKYFDVNLISEVESNDENYQDFLKEYGSYVIQRVKLFSNKFDEIKSLNIKSSQKQAVVTLKKVVQLLRQGLRVSVNKQERNVITGQAIKLIANDMRDAWKLVSKSIEPLLAVNGSHRYPAPHVSNEEVAGLLKAIDALDGEMKHYLNTVSKSFSKFQVRISSDLESLPISGMLDAHLEKILNIKGGSSVEDEGDDDGLDDDEEEDDDCNEEEEEEEEEEAVDDDHEKAEEYEEDSEVGSEDDQACVRADDDNDKRNDLNCDSCDMTHPKSHQRKDSEQVEDTETEEEEEEEDEVEEEDEYDDDNDAETQDMEEEDEEEEEED